jgi:transcriptional regulator with XRE-family HTH domain
MTPKMLAEAGESGDGLSPMGIRLRNRRKALKLTLQEVADASGFSVGFISQIERGITVPSLTSLISVCRVLKIDAGSFFSPPKNDQRITRKQTRQSFRLPGFRNNELSYERLSASFPGNVLRSTLIHEPPGFRSEPMSHEGEEIYFILEGELTIELDGERTILRAGDTAHFPSTVVHATWNHTTETTLIFHTCTMDVFGDGEPSGEANASLVITRAPDEQKSTKARTGRKKGTDNE